jgi:hypothetical protein
VSEFVSPVFEERLKSLAEALVTPERFGKQAVAATVEYIPPVEQMSLWD